MLIRFHALSLILSDLIIISSGMLIGDIVPDLEAVRLKGSVR